MRTSDRDLAGRQMLVLGATVLAFSLLLATIVTVVRGQSVGGALTASAPKELATGLPIPLTGAGAAAGEKVVAQIDVGGVWTDAGSAKADPSGAFAVTARPPSPQSSYKVRAQTASGAVSDPAGVSTRDVTLAAVGDINLGDGPGDAISANGPRYPWTSVASSLRAADIAFGNLECAVSTRGSAVPKTYNFRGSPAALRVVSTYPGLDVLHMANNHAGDFGPQALADTVRYVRRYGMAPVGAGLDQADAAAPRIVTRLGMKIAFVGFSDIQPASFAAGPHRPGTIFASDGVISREVSQARKQADLVIASFHWGIERQTQQNARQEEFAQAALAAGADVVLAAHPHVLQPIVRQGKKLVAYSLGNFVFAAHSPGTSSTGILHLRLSAQGVEGASFQRAHIEGVKPVLQGRALALAP